MCVRAIGWATLILAAGAARADEFADGRPHNWHQWRGPLATGVAPLGNPPTEWSESKNIKWKVEIPGQGSGSPIVWGDRIFLLTAIKTDRTDEATTASVAKSEIPVQQVALTEGAPAAAPNRFGIVAPSNVHQFVVLC